MFRRFKTRSNDLERLDTGDYTREEYEKWHREMWYLHRFFGELRAIRNTLVADVGAAESVSILDVGAGSGGLLRVVKKWLGPRASMLTGTDLDLEATKAIRLGPPAGDVQSLQCDALMLPFADASFDYVFCSLFLHHLPDDAAIRLIREMSRVAKKRIFVYDLHRHPVAYYFYKAASRVFLQPFTQQDGALSILRSFKPAELFDLAKKAGLSDILIRRSAAYRLVLSGK